MIVFKYRRWGFEEKEVAWWQTEHINSEYIPNDEQKILFAKTFGCVRMVYNHWLDRKIRQYEENKTNVTYTICAKEMAAMKKTEEYRFLKEADSIALQQSLRHLDTAFQNFFKQPKTGFPRFKSKKRNKNSYSTVCINGNITLSNGYLRLPKIGQVRLKQHRSVPSEYRLKSVTVSQTPSGKYYASILFEYEDQVEEKELQKFFRAGFFPCMNYIVTATVRSLPIQGITGTQRKN